MSSQSHLKDAVEIDIPRHLINGAQLHNLPQRVELFTQRGYHPARYKFLEQGKRGHDGHQRYQRSEEEALVDGQTPTPSRGIVQQGA